MQSSIIADNIVYYPPKQTRLVKLLMLFICLFIDMAALKHPEVKNKQI